MDKFWSDNKFHNWKALNYLNKVLNLYFSTYCQKQAQKTKLKSNQTLFDRTYSNLTLFFCSKILQYFGDFQNQTFSVLWLKWTQATKWNKISHFFMRHIQIWNYFSLVAKYWNILMTFIIAIFQFHYKMEHKQVKWDKIKRVICKSERGMFIIYKVVDYLNDFWNLFLDKVYLKNEW